VGLSLLAPAFLAGLVALAVPIAVHLIHRERSVAIAFPSLMFLRRVPFRSVRRQNLRDRALLALRCLALVLLALAFARPFLEGATSIDTSAGGARELVVLLDRSYSMGYRGRWERAVGAVRGALDTITGQDRASLVVFDQGAETLVDRTGDRARLRAALDAVTVGFGGTRYGPALKLAQERLQSSDRPKREVLLVTDFQKLGWDGQEEVRLPEGAVLKSVDLSDKDARNVAVADVVLQRDFEAGRERVSVSARLVNKGGTPAADLPVSLELDGRVLQERRVSLAANSSANVSFADMPLPPGATRGTVRIPADALPADDQFHFVLAPGQDVPVLVLEAAQPRPGRGLYLQRALSIGNRPRFRVTTAKSSAVTAAELEKAGVVMLNDALPPAGAAGHALAERVQQGAGAVVVLGDQIAAQSFSGEMAKWLPGTLGAPADRAGEHGASLAYLDRSHALFEPFRGPRTGDFSSARFLRYRPLAATEGVLARFDDGSPALVEKKVGKGRVLLWTSTLDTSWNDLALQPVFLPFVHQLVKHAAGHAEGRAWRSVGEALEVSDLPGARPLPGATGAGPATTVLAVSPSGRKTAVEPPASSLELDEAGFYELRRAGQGPEAAWSVAVNADRAESDLSSLDPEELQAAVTRGSSARSAAEGAPSKEEREQRQALWRLALAGAFVVLVLETVTANRLAARAR
jgi:von Willebrand factor type A domain/Aerotolerance regulator N-terminal